MIEFNRPSLVGNEISNIVKAVERSQLAGDGLFTKKCESIITTLVQCKATLLTHSCTAALEMAAMMCNLEAGDEVIMPSYTFVSTANAFVLRGAIPVFVDIKADTLNIDESLIEQAITSRTKAIVAVHYAGVPCEMDAISDICKRYNLILIEDAAQALSSTYHGYPAGSYGDFSCFSFHETKNIISGEGGCLCINNESFIERAEIIREKGTNRKNFFKGLVDKYTWVDLGSSYVPGELIAAFLLAQLESINSIQKQRINIWDKYFTSLQELSRYGVQLPFIPKQITHNAHLFYLIVNSPNQRDQLIEYLREAGISAPFHYVPLHTSPAGQKFCKTSGTLTSTEDLSARLIRLPLHYLLGEKQDYINDVLKCFWKEFST